MNWILNLIQKKKTLLHREWYFVENDSPPISSQIKKLQLKIKTKRYRFSRLLYQTNRSFHLQSLYLLFSEWVWAYFSYLYQSVLSIDQQGKALLHVFSYFSLSILYELWAERRIWWWKTLLNLLVCGTLIILINLLHWLVYSFCNTPSISFFQIWAAYTHSKNRCSIVSNGSLHKTQELSTDPFFFFCNRNHLLFNTFSIKFISSSLLVRSFLWIWCMRYLLSLLNFVSKKKLYEVKSDDDYYNYYYYLYRRHVSNVSANLSFTFLDNLPFLTHWLAALISSFVYFSISQNKIIIIIFKNK